MHYAGHNPLGALMVVALLSLLGVQATLGLFANDEIFNTGPFAALISKSGSLYATSLHRKLFYVIAAAVALHIAAIAAHVATRREGLAKAMITGRKPKSIVMPYEEIKSSRGLAAAFLFAMVAAAFMLLLQFAPSTPIDLAAY